MEYMVVHHAQSVGDLQVHRRFAPRGRRDVIFRLVPDQLVNARPIYSARYCIPSSDEYSRGGRRKKLRREYLYHSNSGCWTFIGDSEDVMLQGII